MLLPKNWCGSGHSKNIGYQSLQEGKHPLTGQRATSFRLLANQ